MKFENKPKGFNTKEYCNIAYELWGCVPIDVTWAIGTNMYKNYVKSIQGDLNKNNG